MVDRYVPLSEEEAFERGGPAAPTKRGRYDSFGYTLYEQDEHGKLVARIGSDMNEPEDQSLVRDLSWVVDAMNAIAAERDAAREEARTYALTAADATEELARLRQRIREEAPHLGHAVAALIGESVDASGEETGK